MNWCRTAKKRAKRIGTQQASEVCVYLLRSVLKIWRKPNDSTVLENNNDGGGIKMDAQEV